MHDLWQLDVEAINRNADAIVENIGLEALGVYQFLRGRFAQPRAAADPVFQFVFRSFYRLDNAGLTPEFKAAYFEILGRYAAGVTPDVAAIVRELSRYLTLRGKQTLQFSFATKLASTVNPEIPIYDSLVAKMYGFVVPSWYEAFEARLATLCAFHTFLSQDYQRILATGVLNRAIEAFECAYGELASALPPKKKLDFLVWSAGKPRRS
jgi:hypothetical protein